MISVSTPTRTAAPPLQKETTVGNYFVSNYPPYSFWKPEFANEIFDAIERPPRPGNPLGIYVHIPFCRKRCHFCYFKVYTDKDSAAIRGYLEGVLRELTIYARKPFVGGRKPNFVYFGGGTPSYLSVDQLRHLTDGMKALLPWDEAEEVTFECEPGTLSEPKVHTLKELGVFVIRQGIAPFDVIEAQAVELLGDQQFVLQREADAFALAAVAEGRVVDLNPTHKVSF